MALNRNTKIKLANERVEQPTGSILNLSGSTIFDSGSTITILPNRQSGRVLTSNNNGVATWGEISKISKTITQSSHGFVVGNVIGFSNGIYSKAIADGSYSGEIIGIVTQVIDANNFEITQSGYFTGFTGLDLNTTYFLSTAVAGGLTALEPTIEGQLSKAVLVADTTTSAWVLPYPAYVVSTGATEPLTGIINIGEGIGVYDSSESGVARLRSILGSGDTTVFTSGDTIIVNSVSGSLTGASTGLNVVDREVKLGGSFTEPINISGDSTFDVLSDSTVFLTSKVGAGFLVNSSQFGNVGFRFPVAGTGWANVGVEVNSGDGGTGLFYVEDYSTNYHNRSLPDVGYVTGLTSAILSVAITGATNIGSGEGLYSSVLNKNLQLRSLVGSGNTTVSTVGDDIRIFTDIAHNHGISNSGGTNQFSYGIDENIRICGSGGTTIGFDSGTKGIIVYTPPPDGDIVPNFYVSNEAQLVNAVSEIRAKYNGGNIYINSFIQLTSNKTWNLTGINFFGVGNEPYIRFNDTIAGAGTTHRIIITAGSPSFNKINFSGSGQVSSYSMNGQTNRYIFEFATTTSARIVFNDCEFLDVVGSVDGPVMAFTGNFAQFTDFSIIINRGLITSRTGSSTEGSSFELAGFNISYNSPSNNGRIFINIFNQRADQGTGNTYPKPLNNSSQKYKFSRDTNNPQRFAVYSDESAWISDWGGITEYIRENSISTLNPAPIDVALMDFVISDRATNEVTRVTLQDFLTDTTPTNAITGATNIGTGQGIYSSTLNQNLQLRSLVGSGDTTVTLSGDTVIVNTVVPEPGAQSFTGLTDTPSNYVDTNYVRSTASALEYRTPAQVRSDISAETAFSKGNITQGTGISLTGTLTSRLVLTGDVNIALDTTYADGRYVRKDGTITETVTGIKTFSSQLNISGTNELRFSTYGGGFNMNDTTWIRTTGNKSFYQNSGILRTDGTLQVGNAGATLNVPINGDLSYKSNMFFINNTTGCIGMNTTTPQEILDVNGKIRTAATKITDGTNNKYEMIYNPTTQSLDFNFIG